MEFLSLFYIVFGITGLIFRYWVCNIKLLNALEHRRFHLSRILSYFYFIAMIMNFHNNLFTLIVVGALPTMIAAFVFFDLSFYFAIFRKDWYTRLEVKPEFQKDRIWIFLERITMHLPLIITALYIYSQGARQYFVPDNTIGNMVIGFTVVMSAFFLLDPRNPFTEKDEHPAGLIIMIGAILESIVIGVYFYVDFS